MSKNSQTQYSDSVRSEMDGVDWQDCAESEFVDFAEGVTSVAFVFEHDEIGLHGFRFKKNSGLLEPVSFTREDQDDE